MNLKFSDNFWTPNFKDGLTVLFDKLEQGIVEDKEVLGVVSARIAIEEAYALGLRNIPVAHAPSKAGFGRDDGASMRRAYDGIIEEMSREGNHHIQVSENLRRLVLEPFTRWSEEHEKRVHFSRQTLNKKIAHYEREMIEVKKAQKRYFNKCRLLEDVREAKALENESNTDLASSHDESSEQKQELSAESEPVNSGETTQSSETMDPSAVESDGTVTSEELVLAGKKLSSRQAQLFILAALESIPQTSVKVTILGTYDHVSSGGQICDWLIANFYSSAALPDAERTLTLAEAEIVGQDLISNGFLRLIGQVGSKFANSSVMMYQWRPKAYEFAGLSVSTGSRLDTIMSSAIGESLSETWSDYLAQRSSTSSEGVSIEKLAKEVRELDQKYNKCVGALDLVRTELVELEQEHLKFMERCEKDRLNALKSVTLDFLAALSNVVPAIKASIDKYLLYQETMNPTTDLRFLIEAYRTGSYLPSVTVYDNYYSSANGNIFGMDLELRCRGDRRHVPYIVSTILKYLDQVYPRLENDTVRLGLWTLDVPFKSTHALRKELNFDNSFDPEILAKYDPPVVASVLRLYFLELPESVIPTQYYDILRTLYLKNPGEAMQPSRLVALKNILLQLRISNIATLDVLTAHLKRLTTIANASEECLVAIGRELGPCLLHVKQNDSLALTDSFTSHLILDLMHDRDQLFKDLKQAAQPKPADLWQKHGEPLDDKVSRVTQHISKTSISSLRSVSNPPEEE